jgi:O-Antigen ligase
VQTIVSGLLTLSGLVALAVLISVRADVVRNLGGAGNAAVVLGTTVAANAASLLLVGHSSPVLGACALVLFGYGVVRAQRDTVPGGPDPARRRAWTITGVLIVWSGSVDLAVGAGIVGGRLPAYVGGLLTWLAVGLLAGACRVTVRAVGYVGLVLLAAMTIPTFWLASWWTECHVGDLDKCSFVGALFRGAAESENYVAILASVTAIAALIGFRGRGRAAVLAFCFLVIACTGSRTGMLTIAVMCVYCLVAHWWDRRSPQERMPAAAAATISSTAVLFAMYQIYTADSSTLSRRGSIWIAVREGIDGWLLTGVGLSKWGALQDVGESPQHFFHSSYALFLFSGGIVAVALFWLWSFALLRARAPDGRARSNAALVVLVLAYSQTEVIWNPFAVDGLTWIYVLLICGLASVPQPTAPPSRHGADHRPRVSTC